MKQVRVAAITYELWSPHGHSLLSVREVLGNGDWMNGVLVVQPIQEISARNVPGERACSGSESYTMHHAEPGET